MSTCQPHICHAIDCDSPCPSEHLFCQPHWRMLPKEIQDEVLATYVPGQCTNHSKITKEWMRAAARAKAHVAVAEGKWTGEDAKRYMDKYRRYLNKR